MLKYCNPQTVNFKNMSTATFNTVVAFEGFALADLKTVKDSHNFYVSNATNTYIKPKLNSLHLFAL